MIRGREVTSIALAGALVLALEGGAAEETPLSAKSLAERVQLQAEPSYGFRYNLGAGPYGAPTKPLLERRRAYFPGREGPADVQAARGREGRSADRGESEALCSPTSTAWPCRPWIPCP